MTKRASEAGLTLLELALSLVLGTVLITSFFVTNHSLMQAINLAANEVNATSQVAELFDAIVQDLDRADNGNITVSDGGMTVTFKIGNADYGYRAVLAPSKASTDFYVERQKAGGPWTPVGPRHAFANSHPFKGTLKTYDNSDAPGYDLVPMFTLDGGAGGAGGRSPQVILHAVIQTNLEAPPRYVRTRSAPRLAP